MRQLGRNHAQKHGVWHSGATAAAANEVWCSSLLEIQAEMEAGSEVKKAFEMVCQCEE